MPTHPSASFEAAAQAAHSKELMNKFCNASAGKVANAVHKALSDVNSALFLDLPLKDSKRHSVNSTLCLKKASKIFMEELHGLLIDEAGRCKSALPQSKKGKNPDSKIKSKCEWQISEMCGTHS